MSAETAGLGRRMAKGAVWMILLRFAVRGTGLVSIIILARLLVPEDFGLLALAAMMVGWIEAMSELSFEITLVRNQKATRTQYDTVWTMKVIRGAAMAALLLLAAPFAAEYFEEPRLKAVIQWLSLGVFVEGFANIGVVDFLKQFRFDKEFKYRIGVRLATFVITVSLAIVWRDYWVLVVGTVSARFITVGLSYILSPYRPRVSLAVWREIFRFSKWLLINNILWFVLRRADTMIIGKLIGVQTVGIYSVAHEIGNLPTAAFIAPTRRAILPGYAKMVDDFDLLRQSFVNVFSLIVLIGFPSAVGLGLVADPLVRVVLGPNWLAAIPLIGILVFYGFFNVLTAASGPLYLALGKPYILTAYVVAGSVLLVPTLIWSVDRYGAYGAAYAVTGVIGLISIVDIFVVTQILRLSLVRLWASVWRVILAVAIMAIAVSWLRHSWPATRNLPEVGLELAALMIVGVATFAASVMGLWRLCGSPEGPESALLMGLKSAVANTTRALRRRPTDSADRSANSGAEKSSRER